MASLLLGVAGSALGGTWAGGATLLGLGGAQIGGALGALAGAQIDAALAGGQTREGPRLTDLSLQASQEGAPIPRVFGRMRLAGQVIWASRFRESVNTESVGGKGGAGGRVTQTNYTYSISFAVGLCEGACARIGRVWANGVLLDLSRFSWRFHAGDDAQVVDPVIAEIEGDAPAYRGLCHVVFEDMPLAEFGNRIPQLQFEVFRPLLTDDGLENRLTAVALIPGAGEFVYATVPVAADDGAGGTVSQNVHGVTGEADVIASLDELQALAPNLQSVALVVGWFGDDLRAGRCNIRPGVEAALKDTYPQGWRVNGIERADAHVVSQIAGRPAYGGTPSDESVVALIRDLKARGLRVVFYPFLFMDCENYPWRGRIMPAAPDQTGMVVDEVAAFFNGAWGWRRMVLHYAGLCLEAGGVDDFLIGSELRGLTRARSGAANYPAVAALTMLAADVRSIVGSGTRLSYAADWSEYNNHQTGDGGVCFNLDPLWADANIDFIGIDNYLPLSDARDGDMVHDLSGLKSHINGGEYHDWYYANDAARAAQARTPITDGLGKPWVWRAKDLWNWWSQPHFDRPDGRERAMPTDYVPMAKPIVFTELGCPAVNKGANQPNVFYDPKSSESALPYFSDGRRDDLIQRRFLEAHLKFWRAADNNPVSPLYGAPMVEIANAHAWCWDARPHPYFPALSQVWDDAPNYRLGHWLNGRLGAVPLDALVEALCEEAGFTQHDVRGLDGLVTGYAVTDTISPRDAVAPLAVAFGFDVVESEGVLRFVMRGRAQALSCAASRLVLPDEDALWHFQRAQECDLPQASRVTYIDGDRDYATGSVEARRLTGASLRVATSGLPIVLDEGQATSIGERLLQDAWMMRETAQFTLPPSWLQLDPGDELLLEAGGPARRLRLTGIMDGAARGIAAVATDPSLYMPIIGPTGLPRLRQSLTMPGRAMLIFLDLPWLMPEQNTSAPFVGATADPWPGSVAVLMSPSDGHYTHAATLTQPCSFGVLTEDFWSGPAGHRDRVNMLNVKLVQGALASADDQALFHGANLLAVQNAEGGWEVLQFTQAALTGPGAYTLTGLRRGRRGTEIQMRNPVAAGARVVVLDGALAQVPLTPATARLPHFYRWGPASQPITSAAWQGAQHAFEAVGLIPLAPVLVRHAWNGSDLVIHWRRRDRDPASARLTHAAMPMRETALAFNLEILGAGDVVVRRFEAVPQNSQIYSAAQQAADFPSGLPNPLTVRVTQLSSVTGRGRARKEHLYVF